MLFIVVACALALTAWTSWLVRRARLPGWLHGLTTAAAVAVVALTLYTVIRLAGASDRADRAAPAERQRALAHELAAAYTTTAAAIAVLAAWLVAVTLATMWLRQRGRLDRPAP
ncbi:MAG: hypothetical protein IPL61_02385 [Myxococcales bacterium]|nr:hypothetical protein [Myxococcales bacterium]